MKDNPVINCTFVIRSQAEYSAVTQTVNVRCILEIPATGQHCGFTDMEAMLNSLRSELAEIYKQIIPKQKEEKL